jgi:hypothetical protein
MPSPRIAVAAALVATAAFGAAAATAAPGPLPAPSQAGTQSAHALGAGRAPLATIARPRAGATVSGTIRPGLRLRRAGAIRRLELRVDGKLVDRWFPRRSRAPRWRTGSVPNGRHTISVRAVSASGSRTSSVTVNVRNGTSRSRTAPRTPAAPAPAPGQAPAPAPPPSSSGLDIPGVILRTGDFNTGDLSQWSGNQKLRSYSLTTVRSPAREGAYAARFEVRNGDDPLCAAGWGCFGDRAEVQMNTGETEGQERWYSWSTMIGADFPRYSTWQVVSQWHADADGSPPIGFFAVNDDLVLKLHRFSSPGNPIDIRDVWRGPLRRGEWQDIRLHVKWSGSDSVGFVELWIDGVQQTFDNGQTRRYIRTMYPGVGNYFKQGLYRQGGLSSTGVVYHDGFRMSRPA